MIKTALTNIIIVIIDYYECSLGNHSCQQVCNNNIGDFYTCSCWPGYQLKADGNSCEGNA